MPLSSLFALTGRLLRADRRDHLGLSIPQHRSLASDRKARVAYSGSSGYFKTLSGQSDSHLASPPYACVGKAREPLL